MKHYFEYGAQEIEYLCNKDAALARAIEKIGHIEIAVNPDLFTELINSIIGQQISTKAQKTVCARFNTMFCPVMPENIAQIPEAELQKCGISMKKAHFIRQIALDIMNGTLDLAALHSMSDTEVCNYLCQIKGVGVWTAEMLMLFSMRRPDIFSFGDMAILRGLRMLHRHRKITPKLFEKYRRRYSPYGSVASLYLWQISNGVCEWMYDPAARAANKTT